MGTEPAPQAVPEAGVGLHALPNLLWRWRCPGLARCTVPLEGVPGQDRPSPFFLSFLYPEKTDFHRDLAKAASSRVPGLGLSSGRPLGFFSFCFSEERRGTTSSAFPLEPSDEVTEPSGLLSPRRG